MWFTLGTDCYHGVVGVTSGIPWKEGEWGTLHPNEKFSHQVSWWSWNLSLLGNYLGEGNGTPLQYFCLENPVDGGAWWAAVHGVARVGHDWATSLSGYTFMHWRRKWQLTPVFLPGESQGRGSLMGCCLWGRRVGHDWRDLAAAATSAAAGNYLMRDYHLQSLKYPIILPKNMGRGPSQIPSCRGQCNNSISQLLLLLSHFSRVRLCATP